MIRFTSVLWIWTGEAAGRWHFVTVPDEQSAEIKAHALGGRRGFGSVRVEARIGETCWRTSIFPATSGGYILPVKAEVRRNAAIVAGDEVTIGLELL